MKRGFDFTGKVAVITGGNTGIGFAAAKLFGLYGAKVAICGRSQEKNLEAIRLLQLAGIDVYCETCNITYSTKIYQFADNIEKKFGKIDIWVNNVGFMPSCPIVEVTEKEWDKLWATNLKTVYFGAVIANEKMKNGGVLINASSFAAAIPSYAHGAYAATKAAVASLTRSLAAKRNSCCRVLSGFD